MYRITIQTFDQESNAVLEGGKQEIIKKLAAYFQTSRSALKPVAVNKAVLQASRYWTGTKLTVNEIALLCKLSSKTVKNYINSDRTNNGAQLFPHRRPSMIEPARLKMVELRKRRSA